MQYTLQDNIERQRKENAAAIPQVALSAQNKTQKGRFFLEGSGLTNAVEIKDPSGWVDTLTGGSDELNSEILALNTKVDTRFNTFEFINPTAPASTAGLMYKQGEIISAGNNINAIIDFEALGKPEVFAVIDMRDLADNRYPSSLQGFLNADLLTNLRDTDGNNAITMSNMGMLSFIIDDLFSQLPSTSATATIDVSNNPGSGSCDPSIAISKGYTVIT